VVSLLKGQALTGERWRGSVQLQKKGAGLFVESRDGIMGIVDKKARA
jgi:hypothetical protein